MNMPSYNMVSPNDYYRFSKKFQKDDQVLDFSSDWMRDPKKSDIFHLAVFVISFLLSFIVILFIFIIYNTCKSCRKCTSSEHTQDSSSCYTCNLFESSLPSYEKCIKEDNKSLPEYWQVEKMENLPKYWHLEHNCYCTCKSDHKGTVQTGAATCQPYSGTGNTCESYSAATYEPYSEITCPPYSGPNCPPYSGTKRAQIYSKKVNPALTHIYPKEQKLLKKLGNIQIV